MKLSTTVKEEVKKEIDVPVPSFYKTTYCGIYDCWVAVINEKTAFYVTDYKSNTPSITEIILGGSYGNATLVTLLQSADCQEITKEEYLAAHDRAIQVHRTKWEEISQVLLMPPPSEFPLPDN